MHKTTFLLLGALLIYHRANAQNFVKVAAPNPIATFTTNPVHTYVGAAWIDVDNDGDIDLFAAPNKLFRNLGGGNFEQVSTIIGQGIYDAQWNVAGISWADVDHDNDMDCVFSGAESRLYLNDGTGQFTKYDQVPFDGPNRAWACALGDYNGDGILDITLAYPDVNTGSHSHLFASDGTLQWKAATGLEYTDSPAPYTTSTWADFDDDGDFDLFSAAGPAISGSPGPDYIYRNQLKPSGQAQLERIANLPFASELQDGQSYGFIDYDNDGYLDICLANYQYAPNRLYHNNGNGTWSKVNTPFTGASLTNSLANVWGDYDNDGDLDVIFTRDEGLAARLFLNNGQGGFTLQSNSVISQHIVSTGASAGDYDNDGDLDVFLHGRTDIAGRGKALYRNDLNNQNHWVGFKLTGVASNTSAIGAKVRIKVTIGGQTKWLRRDISASNTFQGQNDLRIHFGLGDAATIDSMVIWFPSGAVTVCGDVAINKYHQITEKNGTWDRCMTSTEEYLNIGRLSIAPNPGQQEVYIRLPDSAILKDLSLAVFDQTGRSVLQKDFSPKIDISGLPSGFYWIEVRGRDKTWIGKLVHL